MTIPNEEKSRRREMRRMISKLSDAMAEAGRVIADKESVERCIAHVRLGVFIKYEVSISIDADGEYNVLVTSATHGTKGMVAKMKGLQP